MPITEIPEEPRAYEPEIVVHMIAMALKADDLDDFARRAGLAPCPRSM
jgi:hypothetical protein